MADINSDPSKYYSINIRHLIKAISLEKIDEKLISLGIELKLNVEKSGSVVDVYYYLDDESKKLKDRTKGNTLSSILASLSDSEALKNISPIQDSLLGENWGYIEKAYLFQIIPSIAGGVFLPKQYLVVTVYLEVDGSRWICAISSPLFHLRAQDILKTFHQRILSTGKPSEETQGKAELQKNESISFLLKIPPQEEIFLLDTNSLYPTQDFSKFNLSKKPHSIIISSIVLRELDKLKLSKDGDKARKIINIIESQTQRLEDPQRGVFLNKSKIRLFIISYEPEPTTYLPGFARDTEDDRLIMLAKAIKDSNPQNELTIVSSDPNVRLKAKSISIKVVKLIH